MRARIIIAHAYGHWTAWFENDQAHSFGGDSPGTAADRLWGAYVANAEAVFSREVDDWEQFKGADSCRN